MPFPVKQIITTFTAQQLVGRAGWGEVKLLSAIKSHEAGAACMSQLGSTDRWVVIGTTSGARIGLTTDSTRDPAGNMLQGRSVVLIRNPGRPYILVCTNSFVWHRDNKAKP